MPSFEQKIKGEFAKVFKKADWVSYKIVADYYFKSAAVILKKDIEVDDVFKLLIRNIQKRLFIGLATELLLKACYLKHGFTINKPSIQILNNPIRFSQIKISDLKKEDTFTMNYLIQNLSHISNFNNWATIEKGLLISKVYRNKEGHVATVWHKFKPENYISIENSIIELYNQAFEENLKFKIAMTDEDKGEFSIDL